MTQSFYITTPIYYVNARPHLGHAYTTIIADMANRFHQMKQEDTFFLTGTDEHGDKVVEAAGKENLAPADYVFQISELFRNLWPVLNISYNRFIRTTELDHMKVVSHLLQKIYDSGDIYFSEYEGLYCFGCERFYMERELVDGKCPDHKTEPERIKESNYFFKMSRYQSWLISHIKDHPDFIRPEQYRNEVLAFLREPLEDLCISRPKSRLQWGVTLPFDQNFVTYVWFDALTNYISALDYPNGEAFSRYWPSVQHIVAKDILKPHGIYWPIILKAAGIAPYQHLNVHGYWNVNQSKMSKSIGNVVDPVQLSKTYGIDPFRFFLAREMNFGLDSAFSEATLIERINSDLANDLGNLFQRVLAMCHKYIDGVVPAVDESLGLEFKLGLEAEAMKTVDVYAAQMQAFAFSKAIAAIWEFIGKMNKYIDVTAPWVLAKQKSHHKQLDAVIYNLLEGLRIISILMYPVMPDSAKKMQHMLGCSDEHVQFRLDLAKHWGMLAPGTRIPKSIMLFPRIESDATHMESAENPGMNPEPFTLKPEISIDDFAKIDLRVGTVISAEPVAKAKKLLKLEVNLGEQRTIVSGIATHYQPETLIGKQVIIVANLKPARLMGILPQGMLLASVDKHGAALATVDQRVPDGAALT